MPIFDIEHPDGRKFEVDAPNMNAAVSAVGGFGRPAPGENVTAGMALRGIPIGGAYVPQAEAAIRAAFNPGAAKGETWRQRYEEILPQRQADYAQAEQESPWTSEALKFGGGMAALAPIGATAAGARALGMSGSLASRVGLGAASGAGLSAADAAARGGDPVTAGLVGGGVGAALAPVGSALGRLIGGRTPATALPAADITSAAKSTYNTITDQTRAIPLPGDELKSISKDIAAHVNRIGPRAKVAQEAHDAILGIAKPAAGALPAAPPPATMTAAQYQALKKAPKLPAGDLGDLIDSRQVLGEISRTGKGQNRTAARLAINRLDIEIEKRAPGTTAPLRDAEKNFAIASDAAKIDQKIADAILQAETTGSQGNVGNKIKQAISPLLQKGKAARLAPADLAAVEKVVHPGAGVRALQMMSALDPTSSKLMGALTLRGVNPLTLPLSVPGAASRMMYDRILKNRAGGVSEAMRSRAPATLAQPGYQIPLPPLQYPSPTMAAAPVAMGLAPLYNEQ